MMKSIHSSRGMMLACVALAVLALDQLSKYWLLYELGMAQRPSIYATDFFSLVMVWNHGVSFGMFSDRSQLYTPYLLIALAVTVSAILIRLALKSEQRLERIGYAMVVGGALSNALDRLRMGAVADFFYFHWGELGFPAFNIADSAIFLGVCLLLFCLVKYPARP